MQRIVEVPLTANRFGGGGNPDRATGFDMAHAGPAEGICCRAIRGVAVGAQDHVATLGDRRAGELAHPEHGPRLPSRRRPGGQGAFRPLRDHQGATLDAGREAGGVSTYGPE